MTHNPNLSRLPIAAFVLATALAACVGAPPTRAPEAATEGSAAPGTLVTPPAASVATSPSPGGLATPSASLAPAPSPSAGISASPTAVDCEVPWTRPTRAPGEPPAPDARTNILTGMAYDEEGQAVDGAVVTVRSLEAQSPYAATTTTVTGSWVVNNFPFEQPGLRGSLAIEKAGYTSRRLNSSALGTQFHPSCNRAAIWFGRPAPAIAPSTSPAPIRPFPVGGVVWALSPYPEVAEVAAGDGPAGKVAILRFSHAFDPGERARVQAALRLFAGPPLDGPDTELGAIAAEIRDPVVRQGSTGLGTDKAPGTRDHAPLTWVLAPGDAGPGATLTWDADGQTLTVVTADAVPAGAMLGFVRPADGQPLLAAGAQGLRRGLGTNRAGERGQVPTTPDTLLRNVFWTEVTDAEADLDQDGRLTTREIWAATHRTAVAWPSR